MKHPEISESKLEMFGKLKDDYDPSNEVAITKEIAEDIVMVKLARVFEKNLKPNKQ